MSKAQALIDKNIKEYKLKPLKPLTFKALSELVKSPAATIDSFKPLYQQDPIFCWSVLDIAYQRTKNRASQPYAVDHAFSTIGLGGVEQTLNTVSNTPDSPLTDEVNFILSSSLLASEIAHIVGEKSLGKSSTRWTALMYQMPDTLLWHLHPKSMWRIFYRKLTLPKNLSLFEESKLGFNLQEWRINVAQKFHLGEKLSKIYPKNLPENPKALLQYAKQGLKDESDELSKWHRQEEWLVILCNRLARALLTPWHYKSVERHKQLLRQVTNIPVGSLSPMVYQAVENISKQLTDSPLICPAVPLVMLPSKPYFPTWLNDKSSVKKRIAQRKNATVIQSKNSAPTNKPKLPQRLAAITSTNKEKPKGSVELVESSMPLKKAAPLKAEPNLNTQTQKKPSDIRPIIIKLTQKAQEFNSTLALVQFGLKAIIENLGYNRASFLTINPKAKLAETKLALSKNKQEKVRPDFSYSSPTPLIKFIEQGAFMKIDKIKNKNSWLKLPIAIQKNTEQFIFFSVKPSSKVVALIYIDSNKPEYFSKQKIQALKQLLLAITKGIALFNSTKK